MSARDEAFQSYLVSYWNTGNPCFLFSVVTQDLTGKDVGEREAISLVEVEGREIIVRRT